MDKSLQRATLYTKTVYVTSMALVRSHTVDLNVDLYIQKAQTEGSSGMIKV